MKDLCVVVITYYESVGFFTRLAYADGGRRYLFITTSPVSHFKLLSLGFESKFIWPKLIGGFSENKFLLNTLEFKKNFCNFSKLSRISDSIVVAINSYLAIVERDETYLLTWNGDNVSGAAIRMVKAASSEIKTGFFEISNIPGKLFVDGLGVNKNSSLFQNIKILDGFPYNELKFKEFRRSYLSLKNNYTPDRSKSFSVFARVIEFLYVSFLGPRYFDVFKPIKDIKNKNVMPLGNSYAVHSLPTDFVLYPMQVRTDTQVILNSNVNVMEGLKAILLKTTLPVVLTPHPFDLGSIEEIKENFKEDVGRIIISREKTFSLLPKAQKVFVINSTVGLESLILGKDVEFLGESFYGKLNDDYLGSYVQSFLVDIEFYSKESLSKDSVTQLFHTISMTNVK
jgi:capsular polysaccharide export protein